LTHACSFPFVQIPSFLLASLFNSSTRLHFSATHFAPFSITSHISRSLQCSISPCTTPLEVNLSSFIALHFTAIHSKISEEQRTSPPCSAQHWDNVSNLEKFLQKMRSVTSPRLSSYELTSCADNGRRTLPRRDIRRGSLRRTRPRRTQGERSWLSKSVIHADLTSCRLVPVRNGPNLLDLPAEIRCMIWELCRPRNIEVRLCADQSDDI
jgi:hypothetical protein